MTDRSQRTMKMGSISGNVVLDAAGRRSCKYVEPLESVVELIRTPFGTTKCSLGNESARGGFKEHRRPGYDHKEVGMDVVYRRCLPNRCT